MMKILDILHMFLPQRFFKALVNFLPNNKYSTSTFSRREKNIHWSKFQKGLELINLQECSSQLRQALIENSHSDNNVQIFHIDENHKIDCVTEPCPQTTKNMIRQFFNYIYKRNVLASLVKYILLKPQLNTWKKIHQYTTKKSTFYSIYQRLSEIIFESVLLSFNGGNYDNYLISNELVILLSEMRQKIHIFKKGATISTIIIKCKSIHHGTKVQKHKKNIGQWPMNLFIKDVRNLLSPTLSLDKVGKLFNLKVSKLCFPYEQATSIQRLKQLTSLQPSNEEFWKDNFSGKTVSLESRLEAQQLFEEENFTSLYDYNTYYLTQDCILLHAIVSTLFESYLSDSINIFLRRVYSQSSLAYQQFYIVHPAKQLDQTLAPLQISQPFYNYMIKQSVVGGLCTSFVHGPVGVSNSEPINSHLKFLDPPLLNPSTWPNFCQLRNNWKHEFKNQACGISTFDIRSLYPSASVKKIPVGMPLFYTRIPDEDEDKLDEIHEKKHVLFDINGYCKKVREEYKRKENKNDNRDFFGLIMDRNNSYGNSEYNALCYYLKEKVPNNATILRFQSQFTALGQFYFGPYPVDGFLSYIDEHKQLVIKIIQYHSTHYHGHKHSCNLFSPDHNTEKYKSTQQIKENLWNIWFKISTLLKLSPATLDIVEIWDCDFHNHQVPRTKSLLRMKKKYSYKNFLTQIYDKSITGFLVVKDLKIKQENQNPLFGFIVQKATYGLDQLSPYTQCQMGPIKNARRVISMHYCKSFMVINTEYFVWLHQTFGFEETPDIYHALCFQLDDYLRNSVESKLSERKQLKQLIQMETNPDVKQNLEVKAELIKLMLNSSYGYTLCNMTSTKFKHFENKFSLYKKFPFHQFKSGVKLSDQAYLFEKDPKHPVLFQTMLGHVGSYILFQSKIILLKRLYFLLKYLNPSKAQLLYMDTDSAHFLLQNPNLIENIDDHLKQEFQTMIDKHFDSGTKLSGVWVHENFFENAEYFGEKSYYLFNESNDEFITHMKGLSSYFQSKFVKENVSVQSNPVIKYNIFFKSPDFVLYKANLSKSLFENFAPIKRYFVCSTGSLPLKL